MLTPFFIGLFFGATVGAVAMALIAGNKCGELQRQIEMEQCRRNGDCRALLEQISTLKRSNRSLKSMLDPRRI